MKRLNYYKVSELSESIRIFLTKISKIIRNIQDFYLNHLNYSIFYLKYSIFNPNELEPKPNKNKKKLDIFQFLILLSEPNQTTRTENRSGNIRTDT